MDGGRRPALQAALEALADAAAVPFRPDGHYSIAIRCWRLRRSRVSVNHSRNAQLFGRAGAPGDFGGN